MSAIEQISTLMETLSFAEKLSLNERIATAIRKEGGGKSGAKGKAAKSKSKGEDGDAEAKPKRKAAAGTLAWTAYVKHIKTTQPDAFDGVTKESDKLVIVKGIRAEDPEGYKTFAADWKEKYAASEASASEAEAEDEEEVVAAPPAPVVKQTPAEKLAALKAAKAAAASVPAAPAAAAAKKVVKAAPAAAAAVKEAKPVAAKAKAVEKAKPKVTEEPQMAQLEIDGKSYWHDPDTQGLWEVTGETFAEGSAWSGYYQVDNDEEPIRYTENFGDE